VKLQVKPSQDSSQAWFEHQVKVDIKSDNSSDQKLDNLQVYLIADQQHNKSIKKTFTNIQSPIPQ
jgi:hypothetical protein